MLNANANADTNENIPQRRQRFLQRRERYERRNNENRDRRSSILPRRILQRRNSSPQKDKCPFCRQEIENTYRIYY